MEESTKTEGSSPSGLSLSNLSPGRRPNRKRIGRGNASGHGKTSGKGHKGQQARSGYKSKPHFEGGQMPFYRRIPKLGFSSRKRIECKNTYKVVQLSQLEAFENGSTIDPEALAGVGIKTCRKEGAGLKVVGGGELTKKLTVKLHAVTASARSAIEGAGGTIELINQTKQA